MVDNTCITHCPNGDTLMKSICTGFSVSACRPWNLKFEQSFNFYLPSVSTALETYNVCVANFLSPPMFCNVTFQAPMTWILLQLVPAKPLILEQRFALQYAGGLLMIKSSFQRTAERRRTQNSSRVTGLRA